MTEDDRCSMMMIGGGGEGGRKGGKGGKEGRKGGCGILILASGSRQVQGGGKGKRETVPKR